MSIRQAFLVIRGQDAGPFRVERIKSAAEAPENRRNRPATTRIGGPIWGIPAKMSFRRVHPVNAGLTQLSHRKAHDMAVGSQRAERKSLSAPDETRNFPKGKLEIVTVGGTSLGRATFEPGWKWSECVKPIAKTDSCQAPHLGYVISGRMKVVMDNGEELDFGPGDAMSAPPGHDAWIVGDDKCVVIDFVGYQDYAKPK